MRLPAPPWLLTAAALAVVLTGCDGSPAAAPSGGSTVPAPLPAPEESAFAEGDCALAAPDVLAVGQLVPRLGEDGEVEAEVKDGLATAQERLRAVAGSAVAPAREPLDDLVLSIGLVRIRADGNTYEPSLGEDLRAAYERTVETCTAGSS